MKQIITAIVVLCVMPMSSVATASPASDALATCMIDSLNGKERKNLGKWIFLAMSAHPEMAPFANVSDETRNETDEYIGNLVTRLLVDDCGDKVSVVVRTESSIALTSAFELVGRVAMQELMTDGDVNIAITGFEKYLDKEKINAL